VTSRPPSPSTPANGVEIIRPPGDRPYELRDYFIRDPDGNELGFGHRIHCAGDPLPIERVEVPVRLEKRRCSTIWPNTRA
jgi:hypothetical protein